MAFIVVTMLVMPVTVPMIVLVGVLVMWHILVVVPLIAHKVDSPPTRVVLRAVLAPVLSYLGTQIGGAAANSGACRTSTACG
jgi:hypothetical protein